MDLFQVGPVPIFPPTLLQLLGQYSVEIIDRVTIHVSGRDGCKTCLLRLYTPLGTTFRISCETVHHPQTFEPFPPDTDEWAFSVLFDQTISALLLLPLGSVTTLSIGTGDTPPGPVPDPTEVIAKLATLLRKCRGLDEMVLENYPPRCLTVLLEDDTPPIRILIIKHSGDVLWEELVEHTTEVARVRHSRGAPLKRIEIVTATEGGTRIEQLESWVQEVEYRVEPPLKR